MAEPRVGDFETVEERYGGGFGHVDEAMTALQNAASTELDPGTEAATLDAVALTAGYLQEQIENLVRDLKRAADNERRKEPSNA